MKIKNYCGCCQSEDCYKDMSNEYFYGKSTEVYSKLLMETFNISVNIKTRKRQKFQLRDAAKFKKQVLETQETIEKLLDLRSNESDIDSNVELKEEDDFDDRISEFSESDFAWDRGTKDGQIFVIKMEDKKENGINPKMIKSNICSRNKTSATSSLLKTRRTQVKSTKGKRNIPANTAKFKNEKLTRDIKITQTDINRRENTIKLLQNSNMCLFRSLRTKYGCYACKATFVDVTKLREHTETHDNKKYLIARVKQLRGLSCKNVDISDLKCNKCFENCTDLIDLRNHLTKKHNLQFSNSEHFLIPYRLKNEFRCVLCSIKFNTFTRLLIHMNVHYTNNVCDVCGQSFINRISLRSHLQAMHTEKKCTLCPAILLTHSSKSKHMRKIHNLFGGHKRYCNLCDKTFRYTYMLQEHKIKEHNFERPVSKCSECEKTFHTPQNLKIHMRSVHIKERNYPCMVCGMRFFTKCDQKRHEKTHEDVRAFSCTYCDAKFKFKDSCRRHLKRQHGHISRP